eukprot:975132-Pelagomonas_calceolata.AAC.3
MVQLIQAILVCSLMHDAAHQSAGRSCTLATLRRAGELLVCSLHAADDLLLLHICCGCARRPLFLCLPEDKEALVTFWGLCLINFGDVMSQFFNREKKLPGLLQESLSWPCKSKEIFLGRRMFNCGCQARAAMKAELHVGPGTSPSERHIGRLQNLCCFPALSARGQGATLFSPIDVIAMLQLLALSCSHLVRRKRDIKTCACLSTLGATPISVTPWTEEIKDAFYTLRAHLELPCFVMLPEGGRSAQVLVGMFERNTSPALTEAFCPCSALCSLGPRDCGPISGGA